MKLGIVNFHIGSILFVVRNYPFYVEVNVRLKTKVVIFKYLQHLVSLLNFLVFSVDDEPIR